MKQPEGHHTLDETFGYQRVASDERSRRIRRVFEQVAPRYDLMNDLMSFGIHRLWKRNLVKTTLSQPVELLVDLAGGTGDVARQLRGAGRRVVIVDPSLAMMNAGRARTGAGVSYLAGIGESIPLADHSVDALTIAFGIRNVTSMPRALAEITRVLKPGGRCLCLEFSSPLPGCVPSTTPTRFWLFHGLAPGWRVRRRPIRIWWSRSASFPDQEEMKALMETAGLSDVTFRNLSFGIACLHVGTKP